MFRLYLHACFSLTVFVAAICLFLLLLIAPLPIPANTPSWQLLAAFGFYVMVTAAIGIDCIRNIARIVRRDAQKDWSLMLAGNASTAPISPAASTPNGRHHLN